MKIKTLFVDDKASIRDAIKVLFSTVNDIELVADLPNAIGLEDAIARMDIDILLMDIDMPGVGGIEAVRRIRNKGIEIPIIMLTVFEDEEKIFNAIRAGANGYLLKNTKPSKIVDAVRDVYNGGASFTPIIAKKVLRYFQISKSEENNYNLSPREKEVLSHLVKGRQYKVIAQAMNISYETVRSHMKSIYSKIHVTSLTEAVAKTINEKLLD